jgi:hypothetical protein
VIDAIVQQGLAFIVGVASSVVVVLLGVESVNQRRRKREQEQNFSELYRFWGDGQAYNIVCGIEDPVAEGEIEPRLGYAEAYGLTEIRRVLEDLAPNGRRPAVRLKLLRSSDRFDRNLFDDNVIIFGGALSLSRFGVLCDALELPYRAVYKTSFARAIVRFEDGEPSTPSYHALVDVESQTIVKDFGSVARVQNPENGKVVVLYDGLYSAGLLAAVLYTTSNDKLKESGFSSVVPARGSGVELVVQIKDIIANQALVPDPNVAHASPWVSFPAERKAFSRGLEGASKA